jgi:glucose/arabinose dehydrogenase
MRRLFPLIAGPPAPLRSEAAASARAPRPQSHALAASIALAALLVAPASREASAQAATLPTGFTDQLVIGGLSSPTGMAFLPDGRLLLVEQFSARIRLLVNGALAATDPVVTVPSVRSGGERGLLGIAVDPGFPARPYVYIHCDDSNAFVIRITRFTVAGDLAFTGNGSLTIDPATRRDVITGIPDVNSNHNGGTVRFGPDGKLYASFGEDGMGCAAQDTSGLRGVILRMDVTGIPAGGGSPPSHALIAPPDNPFPSGGLNGRLIFAFGLRNPFRFQIDPLNGALFIGDVGQDAYEELDRAPSGGLDFGWERFEGPLLLDNTCDLTRSATAPIQYFQRGPDPTAVISAGVYRAPGGATQPFPGEYDGNFFFSEYYSGFLRRLVGSGSSWNIAQPAPGQADPDNWGSGLVQVSDYAVGPDGALWFCRQFTSGGSTGQIRRIAYTGTTGVPGPAPGAPRFAAPWPSPAAGDTHFSWTLSEPATVTLVIFDLQGRIVRRLVGPEAEEARAHARTWDGSDDRGRRLPPGVYRAVLTAGGSVLERRTTRVR